MAANRSITNRTLTALVLTGVVTLFSLWTANLPAQQKATTNPDTAIGTNRKQNKSVVHLYFMDKNNQFLIAEERALSQTGGPIRFGQAIVEALIEGPGQKLAPTIPQNTRLRALFISEEGTCYVDLSVDIQENHPGGVATELLTVYSIVNSLTSNQYPELLILSICASTMARWPSSISVKRLKSACPLPSRVSTIFL